MKNNLTASRIDQDPTKQAGTRRRAMANIRRRLAGARSDVLRLASTLPAVKVTNRAIYRYELDDYRLQGVDQRIREIINYWFETQTDDKPARFFFDPYIGAAYGMGTADSANRTQVLGAQAGYSTLDLSQLEVEQIFSTGVYQRRVQLVYGRAFNEMKGFAGQTSTDLARVLSQIVADGRSPRDAQKIIRQRFEVADSRAERISRTEINRAYNVARTEQAQDTRQRLGIDVRVAHRSALLPTTRYDHGRRHGTIHTMQEQNDWWDEGANRINCYCGVIEVVLDKDGKPFSGGVIEKMKKQKEAWFPAK